MQLVAPKKNLLRLLARCQGVADKKSTMPVLANVLLSAEDELRVAATDLYISVAGSISAEVKKKGSVAVPARDIYERVKAMPEGSIELSVNEGAAMTIKAVASARRYTVHGLPGSDFPVLPEPAEDATKIELSAKTLGRLINCTHFSISTDETRAHLNSALFEGNEGKIKMVTTDGHRLSKMEIPVEGLEASTTMLLPLKAVTELRRLTDEVVVVDDDAVLTISQTGPNAFFEIGDIQFSIKLIDAQFPPYDQVIPALTDRAVLTPRVLFAEALRAVSLAASDRTGGVKLAAVDNVLKITSESPESGNGFDEVAVEYSGPEVSVGFNARYILDVLGCIEDDEITLGLSGELDPAVVKPATQADKESYIAVVMPMRI